MNDSHQPPGLTCYAAVYTRGPRWDELEETRDELCKAHIEYQHGHYDAGRLLMGGPYTDREFGLALFTVPTKEEALKIVGDDPAVSAGVYNVDVATWVIALNAFDKA